MLEPAMQKEAPMFWHDAICFQGYEYPSYSTDVIYDGGNWCFKAGVYYSNAILYVDVYVDGVYSYKSKSLYYPWYVHVI